MKGLSRNHINIVGLGFEDHKDIMATKNTSMNTSIPTDLIAPCGMNCRLCWSFIRERNPCSGCRRPCRESTEKEKKHRSSCRIKNCDQLSKGGAKYCSDKCSRFPCTRLKQLDERYKSKFGMSMLDNLMMINDTGIREFIRREKIKWTCPKCDELLSVHRSKCRFCGYDWYHHQGAQQKLKATVDTAP